MNTLVKLEMKYIIGYYIYEIWRSATTTWINNNTIGFTYQDLVILKSIHADGEKISSPLNIPIFLYQIENIPINDLHHSIKNLSKEDYNNYQLVISKFRKTQILA